VAAEAVASQFHDAAPLIGGCPAQRRWGLRVDIPSHFTFSRPPTLNSASRGTHPKFGAWIIWGKAALRVVLCRLRFACVGAGPDGSGFFYDAEHPHYGARLRNVGRPTTEEL
jgi:hypothetical protein